MNVTNSNSFQNEILATGFNLPTNIEFLPDGRMLVVEFAGTIKVVPPPYVQADPTPFLQIDEHRSAGCTSIGDLSTSSSTRSSPPTSTTTSSTRRDADP